MSLSLRKVGFFMTTDNYESYFIKVEDVHSSEQLWDRVPQELKNNIPPICNAEDFHVIWQYNSYLNILEIATTKNKRDVLRISGSFISPLTKSRFKYLIYYLDKEGIYKDPNFAREWEIKNIVRFIKRKKIYVDIYPNKMRF